MEGEGRRIGGRLKDVEDLDNHYVDCSSAIGRGEDPLNVWS